MLGVGPGAGFEGGFPPTALTMVWIACINSRLKWPRVVPENALRVAPIVGGSEDGRAVRRNVSVMSGMSFVHVPSSYRTEQYQTGTRTERYQSEWKDHRVWQGWNFVNQHEAVYATRQVPVYGTRQVPCTQGQFVPAKISNRCPSPGCRSPAVRHQR